VSAPPTRPIGFRFHPEAESDLDHIAAYIEERNPHAALKVIRDIRDAVAALVSLPHQGHRRPDLTERPLRFITVYDYLIAYAPNKTPLWVLAMLYGSRDPDFSPRC
jgi:plasmid stabilization system protein ParE